MVLIVEETGVNVPEREMRNEESAREKEHDEVEKLAARRDERQVADHL
jgi:hypothetical protein